VIFSDTQLHVMQEKTVEILTRQLATLWYARSLTNRPSNVPVYMNTKLITATLFHKLTCVLSVILSRKW